MSGRLGQAQLRPIRFGETELLVETTPVAGTERTSTLEEVAQRVVDVADQVDEAIIAVASSVARTVSRLAERASRPERVEVEFGLKFNAKGKVFVVEASGEAALRVLVEYRPAATPGAGLTGATVGPATAPGPVAG